MTRLKLRFVKILALAALLMAVALPAAAQTAVKAPAEPLAPSLEIVSSGQPMSVQMQIILLLTLLTLLPAVLASLTPFLRIVIVLHFLRQALGTQTAPGNHTLLGLSLVLTLALMQPVLGEVYDTAVQPLRDAEVGQWEAVDAAKGPLKRHLARFARESEVALMLNIMDRPRPNSPEDLDLAVLAPAYTLSELKTAFQIGAVLFLPFLIIDLIVASVTLSLGMVQLPPVMISMPFKLLLFVLADGWNLVVGSLIKGFYN